MRLNLILPTVEPTRFDFPKKCPQTGCPGMRFIPQQEVGKKIVDGQHPEVTAWRGKCKQCGHVIRVYLKGVSQKQISKRVNGMAVMLYILRLSYGAVETVLHSLGMGIGKTSVYRAVQAVIQQVTGLKREKLLVGYQTKAIGADVSSVGCNGKWVKVGIVVDAINGMVLSIDELPGEEATQLHAWLESILEAVDAEVVVSDETGRSQQVCKSHAVRNTEALVEELSTRIGAEPDHSLQAIQITPEQALEDLTSLKEMIHAWRPEYQSRLEESISATPTLANQVWAKI